MRGTVAENYKVRSLLRPTAQTATATGTAIDLGPDYREDAVAILDVGAVSGTSPTLDVTIEASDASGGTYSTIATFGQVTAANKLGAVKVQLDPKKTKRWVRAKATIAGTSPSFTCGVTLAVESEVAKAALNDSTPA